MTPETPSSSPKNNAEKIILSAKEALKKLQVAIEANKPAEQVPPADTEATPENPDTPIPVVENPEQPVPSLEAAQQEVQIAFKNLRGIFKDEGLFGNPKLAQLEAELAPELAFVDWAQLEAELMDGDQLNDELEALTNAMGKVRFGERVAGMIGKLAKQFGIEDSGTVAMVMAFICSGMENSKRPMLSGFAKDIRFQAMLMDAKSQSGDEFSELLDPKNIRDTEKKWTALYTAWIANKNAAVRQVVPYAHACPGLQEVKDGKTPKDYELPKETEASAEKASESESVASELASGETKIENETKFRFENSDVSIDKAKIQTIGKTINFGFTVESLALKNESGSEVMVEFTSNNTSKNISLKKLLEKDGELEFNDTDLTEIV